MEKTGQEGKIADLAVQRALDVMQMDPEQKGFNPGMFDYRMKQAILGFRFKREIDLNRRTEREQGIRVVRMVFDTPEKRMEYIKGTVPHLLPAGAK